MGIVWKTPDGVAITSLAEQIDPAEHARALLASGAVPADWTVVGTDMVLPAGDIEDMTINAGAVVIDAGKQLARAKASALIRLQVACQEAITGGVGSTALGAPHKYGSAATDQSNLSSAMFAAQGQPATWSTPLWCADAAGAWSYVAHTPAQLAQVNADFVAARAAHQLRYAGLVARVNSASTIDDVKNVTW